MPQVPSGCKADDPRQIRHPWCQNRHRPAPENATGGWRAAAFALSALLLLTALSTPLLARSIKSYAVVQVDGSLQVQGKKIWLHGVDIPRSNGQCVLRGKKVNCIPRATQRALAERIQGFVTCDLQRQFRNRSLSAFCYVGGGGVREAPLDLGAWLIAKGLAFTSADAPFDYVRLERVAERRGLGLWKGFRY